MAEETTGVLQPKGRTKAKTRYLKHKKERRKLNKKAKAASSNLPQSKNFVAEDDTASEKSEEDEDEEAERDEGQQKALPVPTTGTKSPTNARRKKRQKVSVDVEDVEMEVPEDTQPPKSPVPTEPLPSFPLPALPDAPLKSILALQGLNKGLVDAEIVAPSTLLAISSDASTDGGTILSEKMRRRLHDLGITELFAVQTSLLPFLLPRNPSHRALYQPYHPPRDVCVSAPTGSGKTLAYAVPIIEILSSRIVTRLRALIVLPTRDLVVQVRETFEALSKGRGLKIGTATGQHSFSHEQSQLIADSSSNLSGGSSKVDVLICTPGRLIDHLNESPNFSLQHLRFLVIDEADRLLAQSFQDWLAQVLSAIRPPKQVIKHSLSDVCQAKNTSNNETFLPKVPDAVAPAFLHLLPYPDVPSFITEKKESSCQKLLFSATLTRDPGKIAALELRNPKYFVVHGNENNSGVLDVVTEKFTMPATLKEHLIVCETAQKPLIFFHLVHSHDVINVLVFTKSAESTTRLVKLLEFFENSFSEDPNDRVVVRAYSSDLGVAERKSILESFKAQKIQILVCSDLISRGIDISHVSHVVSYDAPVDMRKYVHRVGRTARAGREGDAWTLVEEQEARHFKNMMKESDHLDSVKRLRLSQHDLEPLVPHYDRALALLKEVYSRS
ncbi:DEAD-domain-containing protein [Dendrothele bispora CBS 962.96]|uniref:ATP-dependent RNA helicase n=1 Tax=Dendrothele bispora (strain CBS 962.96) TaxID=1314807 RepID=A0A4S8MJB0_DENBC|nr:DEAD-domain-containing protein [Dendrothele bispora CBS 962.96]